jgi:hypothetical protein
MQSPRKVGHLIINFNYELLTIKIWDYKAHSNLTWKK